MRGVYGGGDEAGYEVLSGPEGLALLLKGPWRPEMRDLLRDGRIRHIRLNHYHGFRDDRIDFLSWAPALERVDLAAVTVPDLSPLYALPRLRALTLNGRLGSLDFDRLPALEWLRCSWSARKYGSLLHCAGLRSLELDGYSGADLRAFAPLAHLRRLLLGHSRLETLDGVAALPELRELALTAAPRLRSLRGLRGSARLAALTISGARALTDVDDIRPPTGLAYLRLERCGVRVPDVGTPETLERIRAEG